MPEKIITKRIACLLIVLICWLVPAGLAMAEGDGSGGGQNVPLGLAASTPADGAQNVALDAKIKLVFNKNVINMTVKENNLRCFSLYAGSLAIPVEVQMADDQIYPELKREVTLVPRQRLQAGTGYTVVISKALQAKNGTVLGQDVKVNFSTVMAQGAQSPAAEETPAYQAPDGKDNAAKPDSKSALENADKTTAQLEDGKPGVGAESSAGSQIGSIDQKALPSADKSKNWYDSSWFWPVLIVVVIVLGAAYGYLRRRR